MILSPQLIYVDLVDWLHENRAFILNHFCQLRTCICLSWKFFNLLIFSTG